MTRKDYELIAATIRRTTGEGPSPTVVQTIVSRAFADALAADNPRFDRARFLAACGVAPSRATTGAEG